MGRYRNLTFTVGVVLLSATAWAAPGDPSPESIRRTCNSQQFSKIHWIEGSITKVVDGDTVGLLYQGGDYRIRMVGIDTPETHFLGKSQGYWGEEAHSFLERLLPIGAPVRVALKGDKCDSYGRILGDVFYRGKSMNDAQLSAGLAVNYCIYPDEGCLEKSDVLREAMKKGRGFYGGKPRLEQLPYVWRDTIRGTAPHRYLGNLRTGRVYRPGSFRSVPIADRIFFNRTEDIQPPYFLAE